MPGAGLGVPLCPHSLLGALEGEHWPQDARFTDENAEAQGLSNSPRGQQLCPLPKPVPGTLASQPPDAAGPVEEAAHTRGCAPAGSPVSPSPGSAWHHPGSCVGPGVWGWQSRDTQFTFCFAGADGLRRGAGRWTVSGRTQWGAEAGTDLVRVCVCTCVPSGFLEARSWNVGMSPPLSSRMLALAGPPGLRLPVALNGRRVQMVQTQVTERRHRGHPAMFLSPAAGAAGDGEKLAPEPGSETQGTCLGWQLCDSLG